MAREAQATLQSKIADDNVRTAVTTISAGIKVTIHIPENVRENIRQQKINRIYDILSPKTTSL